MSNLLVGLNPEQRQAVETIEGPVLVLAGPGSGKTRVLTHRIAYMIERGIPSWRILAVTFTNKAAREMRHRLNGLIANTPAPQEGSEAREEKAQEVMMGTFHSICARILRRHIQHLGYDNSFLIYDSNDQRTLVKRVLRDMNLDEQRYHPNAVHSAISRAKNDGFTPKTFQAKDYREEIISRVYEQYQAKLVENNALDFDDLLLLTLRLFNEVPEVLARYQGRWQYILVDEFQDTNLVQYELVRLLGEKHQQVFVVGDIDQSIYAWRGADYRNILKFEETFPQRKMITLEQNYRSTQQILDAASALIRHNTNRKDKGLWSQLGKGEPITLFEAYDEREEAQFIVRQIKRLKHGEGYRNADFAIMYRMNAQSRALEEAFMRSKLKYTIVGGTRFYQRREVKDIVAYLRLIHNPADSISLGRIINVPKRSIGKAAYEELQAWANQLNVTPFIALQRLDEHIGALSPLPPHLFPSFSTRRRNALLGFYHLLKPIIDKLDKMTLPTLIHEVIKAIKYSQYLRDGSEQGEERWENVLELRNVATQYERLPIKQALPEFLESASLVSDADSLPEGKADAVTLMTLHTAKGLEFPVVFMPGMDNDILPHSRSQEKVEQIEEERRLAYVGITRAKQRLYLIHTFRRRVWGRLELSSPSPFLRELPRRTLKISQEPSLRPAAKPQSKPSRSAKRYPSQTRGTSQTRRTSQTRGTSSSSRSSTSKKKSKSTTKRQTPPKSPWTTRVVEPKKPKASPKPKHPPFKVGDSVRHAKFGQGIVIRSQSNRTDQEVHVLFTGDKHPKKLMASFAKLEKL
ncbi:MAG: ATP-dependent helicase [Ardenticatenaceae bacterium]